MGSTKSNRIAWIDTARGLGILLVIFGHLYSGVITSWIFSFHMPLFFFISGFLFVKKDSFYVFLKKKTKSLLIPYFTLGFVVIVSYIFMLRPITISEVQDILISFVFQQKFLNIWYLTCLFVLEIIFFLLTCIIDSSSILIVLSIISIVFGTLYYDYVNILLYWNIDTCLMALPFFTLGYITKNQKTCKKLHNNKSALIFSMLFLIVNVSFWKMNYVKGFSLDMFYNLYDIVPITYVAAFAGIFFIMILSKHINIGIINYIGKYSIIYFVLHQYVVFPIINYFFDSFRLDHLITYILPNFLATHSYFLVCIIKTVITCIILTALNKMISETKLKFILGK